MSFYTALTGLNAATAQLGVTSNNIANVGTSGFKRSRADFGDIFATSPLQKASSVIGQGVSLKQVSQEFSQGNIATSSNALDLAITGDGFFPLKSADGLQNIYTRNGAFTMNDQYNVVNSAGQALMAASVDSSGKADLGNLNRLAIPKKTTGDAKQTSLVKLGLNFPADAKVVTAAFNRTNAATYNKTTALTVYDQGGNGYLATVYYAKTQNASQGSPYNKWQTYVYIGDSAVNASLIQATDENNQKLYVNKYGQLKSEVEVADQLVNRKTQMFALDNLTDKRTSVPASIIGTTVAGSKTKAADGTDYTIDLTAEKGINFSTISATNKAMLTSLFAIDVDGSNKPVTIDMSRLASQNKTLTGIDIAKEMSNEINSTFGDNRYWDFTTADASKKFTIGSGTGSLAIDLADTIKTDRIAFTAATGAGDIIVGGQTVNIPAARTAIEVAALVKTALSTAGGVFQAGVHAGATITDNGNGSISIAYSAVDSAKDAVGAPAAFTPLPAVTAGGGASGVITTSTPTTLQRADKMTFSAATTAGNITVAGVTVAVTAGMSAANVAAAVKAAVDANAFITGNAGRSITNNGDGSITLKYAAADSKAITLSYSDTGVTGVTAPLVETNPAITDTMTTKQVVDAMQVRINRAVSTGATPDVGIKVSYDPVTAGFKFVPSDGITALTLRGGTTTSTANDLLGLGITNTTLTAEGSYVTSDSIKPNGNLIRAAADQRYGVKVDFDSVTQKFTVSSGKTGDSSSIALSNVNNFAKSLMGLANNSVTTSTAALRGITSSPAITRGSTIGINVDNNFPVDTTNNRFVVTVDNVKGEIVIPPSANYTLDGFMAQLQNRINLLANDAGNSVSGVKVEYERGTNSFKFTSGTASSDSFIKISGSSMWGLANATAGRGETSSWTKPTQFTTLVNGVPVPKYIDERGLETTSTDGFTTLPEWSAVYYDKGELTFDTGGKLLSPKSGSQLDTVFLADGKGALRINIDYSASSQFSSPFAVLSQAQDGSPEGDLVGVNIGDDGLVNASYSNGSQRALGKIILANFSNANGLRQIGDGSFNASAASGTAVLGEAGGAGFGTLRAGARERANVDLTQELVDLITAQRNFQASAKAIETSTSLTQTIIQIRN